MKEMGKRHLPRWAIISTSLDWVTPFENLWTLIVQRFLRFYGHSLAKPVSIKTFFVTKFLFCQYLWRQLRKRRKWWHLASTSRSYHTVEATSRIFREISQLSRTRIRDGNCAMVLQWHLVLSSKTTFCKFCKTNFNSNLESF